MRLFRHDSPGTQHYFVQKWRRVLGADVVVPSLTMHGANYVVQRWRRILGADTVNPYSCCCHSLDDGAEYLVQRWRRVLGANRWCRVLYFENAPGADLVQSGQIGPLT